MSHRPLSFRSPRLVLACVAVGLPLLAAGCAAKPDWTKKGVSASQLDQDYTTCQDRADRRTGYSDPDESSNLSISQRQSMAREEHQVIDACMRNFGYFPTN